LQPKMTVPATEPINSKRNRTFFEFILYFLFHF
jgi:hypothetical protein